MIYVIPLNDQTPLPEKVAKALNDYIAKKGVPPPLVKSIEVEIGYDKVEIKDFSIEDTD